jgi:L-rhamnose 1-dehydrogenase
MGVSEDPQRVLITGASRGIGRACAIEFAAGGGRVAINHPGDDEAAAEAGRLVSEAGGTPLLAPADVADSAQVRTMVADVIAEFGGLDVLVLNAGISPWQGFWDITEEDWDHVQAINLKGQFLVAQAVTRAMVDAGTEGRVISVSSVNALVGGANPAYGASKGGVSAFMRSLAIFLGPHGITCNIVSPGPIATEINDYQGIPGRQTELEAKIPVRRIGQPVDVAKVIRAMADPSWGFVTGAEIVIDGGVLVNAL